jgi:ABC-type multidrug transport system ATPase subunit
MAALGNPVLKVGGLSKHIGARTIVDSLDFELRAGEVLGFLGPNGAGKSTTLRMLTTLVRPNAGSFEILGERFPGGDRRALAGVGALIERADLYPHLSARDNLRLLGRLQGIRRASRRCWPWWAWPPAPGTASRSTPRA